MTLHRIIKIESKCLCKKQREILYKKYGEKKWVMFTDMDTKSTGIISEYELKRDYEQMVGFSSKDGKQLYMEKLKFK